MFAQGDYCDKDSTYVTKFLDFTTDKAKLVKFVKDVKGTGGGDFEECYELVLQQARQKLSWAPGTVTFELCAGLTICLYCYILFK